MVTGSSPKSILLHRPTPWQSKITCSTKTLTRYFRDDGFEVTYLEAPMDLGHIIKWKGYYHVWKNSPRKDEDIWIINPFTPIPIRDRFPLNTQVGMDLSYQLSVPSIADLLSRGNMPSPDFIWCAKPGGSVFKLLFPEAKLIMHVVDYYPAFRGDYIKKIEQRDYEVADHVFLIGHAMHDYVTGELGIDPSKVTVLGQGVSLENYANKPPCPEELLHIPGPRAIWVGVLEKADPTMFKEVAIALKNVGGSLILIGPLSSWATDLQLLYANVYLLGPKGPKEVPGYLLHSDIGLMLYDRRKASVYFGQNPLKLYEYAAAGLAILSTPHREFDFLDSPIIEIKSPNEVPLGVKLALANKKMYAKKSLDFSRKHSWTSVYTSAKEKILHSYDRNLNG